MPAIHKAASSLMGGPAPLDLPADREQAGTQLRYPVPNVLDWARFEQLSMFERAALTIRNRRFRRRAKRDGTLRTVSGGLISPLNHGDLALVCTVRNAMLHLPAFMSHYRRIGVNRFLIVDDRSDDGTREWLERQLDVDLFESDLRYGEAEWGRIWRDRLIEIHGRGRWYVCVDADEFLVYPGLETRKLRSFIEDLERAGHKRAMAPMLDIYQRGPLNQPRLSKWISQDPFKAETYLDGDGYWAANEKFCLSIRGGPRARLFGGDNRLTKFPIVFADEQSGESGASVHGPLPLKRNFAAPAAVLLHQKFHAGSVAEWRRLVEERQHFGDGLYYRRMLESEHLSDDLDLFYAGSIRYRSSEDLVERGFMRDLRVSNPFDARLLEMAFV